MHLLEKLMAPFQLKMLGARLFKDIGHMQAESPLPFRCWMSEQEFPELDKKLHPELGIPIQ